MDRRLGYLFKLLANEAEDNLKTVGSSASEITPSNGTLLIQKTIRCQLHKVKLNIQIFLLINELGIL